VKNFGYFAQRTWLEGMASHKYEATLNGLCALAIMTKAPRAGQVKTRLTPPLTAEEAATLNICFLRDISAAIASVGGDTRGIGCFTPVGVEETYRDIFPVEFRLLAQRDGDLSQRLIGAIEDLIAAGFASVCLINSDSPTAPAPVFAEAARVLSLSKEDVVLGPSDDGGYYLIGIKTLQPRLFEGIDWSTDRVRAQTLERASEIGLGVRLLPRCYDVDDRRTLHRLCDDLLGSNASEDPEIAPATREFLRDIVAREGRDRIWPAVSAQSGR
jgi:rSAM/selenodomain-associated transferase 1